MASRSPWLRLFEFADASDPDSPGEYNLPENLGDITDEELQSLLDEAVARFDDARDGADLRDAGTMEVLTGLRDAIRALRGEQDQRTQARVEAEALVAEMETEIRGADDEANADDASDASTDDDDPSPDDASHDAKAPESVSASVVVPPRVPPRSVDLAQVRRLAPAQHRPASRRATSPVNIVAAADVPGYGVGQPLDGTTGMTEALLARARALPDSRAKYLVASIDLPIPETDELTGNGLDDEAVMKRVSNPNNLVASGGWCAPLEPLYNLFGIDAADGLFDLPTVKATRGGITYPAAITMPADLSTLSFVWTQAKDIDAADNSGIVSDVVKPCIKVPCPTWNSCVLDAYGLCITAGNLQDRAYPELTKRYVELVLNAHAHYMSSAIIGKIVGSATAITGPGAGGGASGILSDVALAATYYRGLYKTPRNLMLEAVYPDWAREAIRADLAARSGVDMLAVSDAQIIAEFAARNVRVQFVTDYQPLVNATAWPATVKGLLYVAGSYVRADNGRLDISVARDSTLNATNDFTVAFTEEFFCIAQLGPAALVLTSAVKVTGATGCCP